MRLLDTREQKSPRFLMDVFPDITITVMESGDYFSGKKIPKKFYQMERFGDETQLSGNLVEIKIGADFGIHTEPLERFKDELYRMACYRQKNPHVKLHAVWMERDSVRDDHAEQIFNNLCFKYHVWGHFCHNQTQLIRLLKDLDTAKYTEFEPYIKRSHEEPTILAKMLRQFPGISSQKAIDLSEALTNWRENSWMLNHTIIEQIIGYKKNNEPRKLALDLIHWLETGEI